jgi:hypothetical protein
LSNLPHFQGKQPGHQAGCFLFKGPCGEIEGAKRQEKRTLDYMQTHVAAKEEPLIRVKSSGKFPLPMIFVSNLETTVMNAHLSDDVCYKNPALTLEFSRLHNKDWGTLTS